MQGISHFLIVALDRTGAGQARRVIYIMYRRGAGQSDRQIAQKVRLCFVKHFPENVKISLFSVFLQF